MFEKKTEIILCKGTGIKILIDKKNKLFYKKINAWFCNNKGHFLSLFDTLKNPILLFFSNYPYFEV